MAGVLITGFEPFGGEAVNPSWEVVKQLDGAMVAGERVVARQLPCVFGEALTALYAALDEHQPVLTIAVGQAGGVLLTETVRATALDKHLTAGLGRWRKPSATHDPAKVVLDLAIILALGGDCLSDIAALRGK